MADKQAVPIWSDANGATRLLTIKTLTGVGPILAEMEAKSNGDWIMCSEGPIDTQAPFTSAATYQSVQDAARLMFETASGSLITLTLPAPDLSIFAADQQTVDPTQITALIAACIGTLSDGAGNAAVSFVGGFYQRSGSLQRGA